MNAADPSTPPLIRIRNLVKSYRRGGQVVPVLTDITLDV
ncbi:MAG TPA: ABC transporter ATP-binding protein, partial [Burkholderiales bacterium]|nr:ABC transporter ATP-binding protein [Burkholderiales bacterium]